MVDKLQRVLCDVRDAVQALRSERSQKHEHMLELRIQRHCLQAAVSIVEYDSAIYTEQQHCS
jgi:hypothetical protein